VRNISLLLVDDARNLRMTVRALAAILMIFCAVSSSAAQGQQPSNPEPTTDKQVKVNWLYGSYVPKEAPLRSLNRDERVKLYIGQTYTTWGLYLKSTLFAVSDQARDRYPEWGDGFEGFAKRLGTRHSQFIVQNSVISLGDGLVGWEPRYDRCRCSGFWSRTRHAIVRSLFTYDRTERNLRPQLFPYAGAFVGSVIATTWEPSSPRWQVKGYQAVITQLPIGMGINWVSEFAPEIGRVFHRRK
jgi:hypothetical protein